MTSRNIDGLFRVSLGLLILLSGCSGRKITTSSEDQSLLQKEEAKMQSTPAESATSPESTRMTEPPFASPPSPQAQPEGSVQQPAPASPGRSPSSQVIAAQTLPPGTLGDIFFDFDRFTLRPEARATLETNAQFLKDKNGMKVLIEGHCDERGTLAYNLVLGERRAQSAKRYLQELGVSASQIQITSYGKERPFCKEHRESCWQQNRRGHFVAK